MIIQCDKCRTKFRIADAKVKPGGVKVRCSRCAHVFHAKPNPANLHKKFTDRGPETARVDTSVMNDLARSSTKPTPAEQLPPAPRPSNLRIPAASTEQAAAALGFAGASGSVNHEAVTAQASVALPSFPSYQENTPADRIPTMQSALPPSPPTVAPPARGGFAHDLLSSPASGLAPPKGYSTPPGGFPPPPESSSPSSGLPAIPDPNFDFDSPLARDTAVPSGSGDLMLGISTDMHSEPTKNGFDLRSVEQVESSSPADGFDAPDPGSEPPGAPVRPKGLMFRSAPPGGIPTSDFEDRFPAPSGELPNLNGSGDFPGPDFPPPADPSQVEAIVSNSGDIPNFLPAGSLDDDPFANIDIDSAPPGGYGGLESGSSPNPFDEPTPPQPAGGTFGVPVAKIDLGQAALQEGDRPAQVMTTAVAGGYTPGGTGVTLDLYAQRAAGPWPTIVGALAGLAVVLFLVPELSRPLIERLVPSGAQKMSIVTGESVVTGALAEVQAFGTRVREYPSKTTERLVVTGTARNLSDTSLEGLNAVVVALEGDHVVARATAPIGRSLEPRVLHEAVDTAALMAAFAEAPVTLQAQGDRPFMVVFPQVPKNASNLRYRVAFIRTETAQKPPGPGQPAADGT